MTVNIFPLRAKFDHNQDGAKAGQSDDLRRSRAMPDNPVDDCHQPK